MAPSDPHRSAGRVSQPAARSDAPSPQRRNDGQLDAAASPRDPQLMIISAIAESWVEVASQPSSSSLSSIGDDIVTTGLRVGSNSYPPRRRRSQQHHPMPASFVVGHPATQGGATSSQEEYDESESEEDRVMTSSTEAIHPSANILRQHTPARASAVITDSDSDDDGNATALGRPSNAPVFRPQPNAFSHPPSHINHRHSTGSAPDHHYHHRPPMANRPHARAHRSPPHFMSPSYQADNDAALRASLTTLLSCAAAARGLPKQDDRRGGTSTLPGAGAGILPSSQPMELRLVPESELMAEHPPPSNPAGAGALKTAARGPPRTASNSSAPSAPSSTSSRGVDLEKTKRTTTTPATAAVQPRPVRSTKKKRPASATPDDPSSSPATDSPFFFALSPSLLTWVVSAGVVVLVSVVGFGAGYVIGREVGRQEGGTLSAFSGGSGFSATSAAANSSASSAAAGCGSELVRAGAGGGGGALRRIRWGDVGRSVAA
ncbi:hypothetical protein C8A05DRAFT_47122 [Staphylotrichum tortipilum]|uniref:Uncharacterized protein n=1 Tax=Staphylotrichum tortipilum TaxID=2831512 RepID=A0AAN6MER8_9PEZI|nr:hypothetical protein C8A05DRAFT_47122 [Staphylotrichum longicolle]